MRFAALSILEHEARPTFHVWSRKAMENDEILRAIVSFPQSLLVIHPTKHRIPDHSLALPGPTQQRETLKEKLQISLTPSSFLLLVVRPGATSSALAPFVAMPFAQINAPKILRG